MPHKDPDVRREYLRRWRDRQGPEWWANERKRGLEKQAVSRAIRREFVNKAKEGQPCVDCGESFAPCAMDFHHIGDDKVRSVADLVTRRVPMERIQEEMDKCVLICANCHRIRHWAAA